MYNEEGSSIFNDADLVRSPFHGAMLAAFGPEMPLPPPMAFHKGILGEDPPEAVALRGHRQRAFAAAKADAKARATAAGQAYEDEDEVEEERQAGVSLEDAAAEGEQLVGARIRVYWPDDDAWYGAKIRKWNQWNGQYHIRCGGSGPFPAAAAAAVGARLLSRAAAQPAAGSERGMHEHARARVCVLGSAGTRRTTWTSGWTSARRRWRS